MLQSYFHDLVEYACGVLTAGWELDAAFQAEDSDFVRFRNGDVRQAGSVYQRALTLDLLRGCRHASATISLAGNLRADRYRVRSVVGALEDRAGDAEEDPHLLRAPVTRNTEERGPESLPSPESVLSMLRGATTDVHLTGHYAAGPIAAGFANSNGQRQWFSAASFSLDASLHTNGSDGRDHAVKCTYAGSEWRDDEFLGRVAAARAQMVAMTAPVRALAAGAYRAYLAPEALEELVSYIAGSAFSARVRHASNSPLQRMVGKDGMRLDPRVTMVENAGARRAPRFDVRGFLKPDTVTLIDRGVLGEPLVSPASAAELGIATNGANVLETPVSLEMSGGTLESEDALARLDRGLFLTRLHYLNFSDRNACRVTGLTRFASFWVENGAIVAPLPVMRFDDSLYHLLGDRLIDLTRDTVLTPDVRTYRARSTTTWQTPGALVDGLRLTA